MENFIASRISNFLVYIFPQSKVMATIFQFPCTNIWNDFNEWHVNSSQFFMGITFLTISISEKRYEGYSYCMVESESSILLIHVLSHKRVKYCLKTHYYYYHTTSFIHEKFDHPVLLVIQSLVRGLVQGVSSVLFWIHCAVKQNIWDTLYKTSYEALND